MPPASPLPALTVQVVSDVVCPWCFLGKRRLERALASLPDQAVAVRWRPFQLDPTIPAGGLDRREYMLRKFGAGRLAEAHARLEQLGREEGIAFAFDAISRSPNTLDAHRLIAWATALGAGDAVLEGLFCAYFEHGRDIGDHAVLAEIASAAGLDRADAQSFLDADEGTEAVREDIRLAQELGIQGVPFFILGGRYGVSGAQSADVLAQALTRAAAEPG